MRKSSVRTLRQENNARERALSRESQREMTDVVVYLRGQDLSPLDQEEIRRDILEMVWEAEARGETMAQVVGQDYRTFCQEIVAAVPRRSRRVRMAAAVEELLPALSVLLGIWLVKKVVEALLRGEAVMHLTLTLGEAISMGVLLAASVGIVTYLCRTALEGERGRSRGKGFFMAWAFCVALLAAIFLPTFLLTNPLLTLWLPVAVAVGANTVYNICAKSTPEKLNSFAALTINYGVAAALSLLLFFVTTGGEKNLIQEIGKTSWAPVVMGLSVVGLELGYILIYRAGWKVSVASLVANLALACILVLVGVLWYKEVLTGHQILGIGACVVGILLISR